MHSTHSSNRYVLFAATVALLCGSGAHAQEPAASPAAQAQYQREMAVCNSGQSNQATATCRIEAERALAEARRGGLTAAPSEQYQKNALQRCDAFQGTERSECETRMRQPESVEGSVQSGGVLRKGITIVPAP